MAQLNLRDRVIETTIAYVGSAGESNASTFARVKDDVQRGRAGVVTETKVDGGTLISLDWRPRDGAKLNDCELSVKLLSTEGALAPEAMQNVLVDADGLVLVLESDPEAAPANERAVAIVREALARAPEKHRPVVVQVNRREGAEDQLNVGGLGIGTWPQVTSYGAKGDGVMETLQRAVDGVVESMQRTSAAEHSSPRPPALRAEGNPLLAALRQILQATVSEQIAELEARLVAHVERQMNARDEATRSFGERLASVDAAMARVEAALRAVSERAGRGQENAASREDVARVAEQISTESTVHRDALEDRLTSLHSWMERIESTVIEAGARATAAGTLSATRTDVERATKILLADADRLHKSLTSEIERAQKTSAAESGTSRDAVLGELKDQRKAAREDAARLGAATQPIVKTLEALSTEMSKWSAQASATDVASVLKRFGTDKDKTREQVDSLTNESRTLATQVSELGTHIQHVDLSMGRRLAEVRDSIKAFIESNDQRAEAMQTELAALTEELRKKNKGWFS